MTQLMERMIRQSWCKKEMMSHYYTLTSRVKRIDSVYICLDCFLTYHYLETRLRGPVVIS